MQNYIDNILSRPEVKKWQFWYVQALNEDVIIVDSDLIEKGIIHVCLVTRCVETYGDNLDFIVNKDRSPYLADVYPVDRKIVRAPVLAMSVKDLSGYKGCLEGDDVETIEMIIKVPALLPYNESDEFIRGMQPLTKMAFEMYVNSVPPIEEFVNKIINIINNEIDSCIAQGKEINPNLIVETINREYKVDYGGELNSRNQQELLLIVAMTIAEKTIGGLYEKDSEH